MAQVLERSYRGKIDKIIKALSSEDKKALDKWLIIRRTKAGEAKCEHYKTNLLALRYVSVPFEKWDDEEEMAKLSIKIKDSGRELVGRNELRKAASNFIRWKFQNLNQKKINRLTDLFQLEKQPFYNKKKYNKNTMPTDEDIKAMFLGMNNLKDKALFTAQEELALPPAVLLRSKRNQWIDCGDHYEFFAEREKNGEKTILILKTGYVHFKRWENEYQYPDKRDDDWEFPNDYDRDKPLNDHYLSDLYRRVCKKQKIKNITPYHIRRRRLMFIQKTTGDIELAAKMQYHF